MTDPVYPDRIAELGAPETRIVILEDNDDFVVDIETVARRIYGGNISWERLTTVEEGLSRLNEQSENLPDIAIVDVGLGDGNGLDFVKAARDRELVFPIIVISENELEEIRYQGRSISRVELLSLGVTDFRSKSFISEMTVKEFLRLVLAVSFQFERVLRIADRPDRAFNSALCRDNIADLSSALTLVRSSTIHTTVKSVMTAGDIKDSVVLYLEAVIKKEQLRLEYTLRFSPREKVQAISIVERESKQEPSPRPPSPIRQTLENLSKILFPNVFRDL